VIPTEAVNIFGLIQMFHYQGLCSFHAKDVGYQVRDQQLTNSTAITMPILDTIWFCLMLNQALAFGTIVDKKKEKK
jgi:hypothetical protein